MGDYEKRLMEKLQEKYRKLYGVDFSGSGIFVKKKRKQLLGLEAKSGGKTSGNEERDRKTLANFWYDVRENVKCGLVDLQLFIETSRVDNIFRVLDNQRLEPIFKELLLSEWVNENFDFTSDKAKIAHMLVETGLKCLRQLSEPYLRRKAEEEIDDAIELSQQLMFNLLTDKEKHSLVWKEIVDKNKQARRSKKGSEDQKE
jgi:hypothetical protein